MRKLTHKQVRQKWLNITEQSMAMNERNDCSVKAVALATGVTYRASLDAHIDNGRRHRQGTPLTVTMRALKDLGFWPNELPEDERPKTIRSCQAELRTSNRYLVLVYNHFVAQVSGLVMCHTKNRLHRVKRIWRIAPMTSPQQKHDHQFQQMLRERIRRINDPLDPLKG